MTQKNRRVVDAEMQQNLSGYTARTRRFERTSYKRMAGTRRSGVNYGKFMQGLTAAAGPLDSNLVRTENGAVVYASSGSALVDFNARATELRGAHRGTIEYAAMAAYEEDAVKFVKLLFQTADIRGGKGERRIFNICMDWMCREHPLVAVEVLELIPEYARWDYLVRLTVSENAAVSDRATALVAEQFSRDYSVVADLQEGQTAHISLLAKWMPSLQTRKAEGKAVVSHLLEALGLTEREYRHRLSAMRAHLHVIEKAMSAKDLDSIDMEAMTSKQQLRYSAYLKRVMAAKRHEYILAVARGEKKMNASVLNPLEIYREYLAKFLDEDISSWNCSRMQYDEDMEILWTCLPDVVAGNGSTLVIRDGSASMTRLIGQGTKATMLEAASAMAIYCSERLAEPFKDKFITFSSRPELVDMSGCKSLKEKICLLSNYDDCSNTDLKRTFDLVLEVAVANKLSQEELPSYLLILSDMEFDVARGYYCSWGYRESQGYDRKTLFSIIREEWEQAGYTVPTLVFWQLNGERTLFPEIDSENGIIFLSGYSVNELKHVMEGSYETFEEETVEEEIVDEATGESKIVTSVRTVRRVMSPEEQLEEKLSDVRYDAVEEAAMRGLAAESA